MIAFILFFLTIIIFCLLRSTEHFLSLDDIAIPYKAYNSDGMPENLYLTEYNVSYFTDKLDRKKINYDYVFSGIPLSICNNDFKEYMLLRIGNYLLGILEDKFYVAREEIKSIIYYFKNVKSPYSDQFTNIVMTEESTNDNSDVYSVKTLYIVYRENKAWGVLIELHTVHKIEDLNNILLLSYNIKGYVFQDKLPSLNTDKPYVSYPTNPMDDSLIINKNKEEEEDYLCTRRNTYKKIFIGNYDTGVDCV